MNPHLLSILIALFYILVFGSLAALRREGLSFQFAIESILAAGILIGLSALTSQTIHPAIFLLLLYLVTTRVRLLVDLANLLARQGYYLQADSLYNLALKLGPDAIGRLIVQLNQGVHHLKQDQLSQATALLEGLLDDFGDVSSPKYKAAAHYNLAVAYQRQGNEVKAIVEFNKVIDIMPASLYAVGARSALGKDRRGTGDG